jgi:hypothetical protein
MSASGSRRVRARFGGSAFSDGRARDVGFLILVGLVTASCTSMLGIDGDYVQSIKTGSGGAGGRVSASGGSGGDGGSAETGGSISDGGGGSGTGGLSSGGAGGAGGAMEASTGCGAAAGDCPSGQKCCTSPDGTLTSCLLPEPSVGCSLTNFDCTRCPAPPSNAVAVCNASNKCDVQCIPDYQLNSNGDCVPIGSGGAGGQGGSGTGGIPPCIRTNPALHCPGLVPPPQKGCTFLSAFPCCKNDGTCGCTYVEGAYCL